MWSTIKTLPATLPEPSSMDRGPRTGVTGAVSASDLHLCEGVGPQEAGGGSWIDGLLDWLAEAVWVPHQMGPEVGQSDKTDQPSTGSSFH